MLGFLALGYVIVMVLAARRIGRFLARSGWRFEQLSLQAAFEIALGWILVSFAIFPIVYFHSVSWWSLFILFLFLFALAFWEALKGFQLSDSERSSLQSFWATYKGLFFVLFVYLVWIILCAVLPPTARDELIYHLAIPREWLREGGVVLLPDNIYSFFPQLAEMHLLLGLGIGGEIAAKLFHAASGLILGLALYGFSIQIVSRRYAFWAALLFISVPSVMVSMSWAYVDLTFSLYAFLAFAAMIQYFERREYKWLVLAGLMTGAATAIKYTGFQLFILYLVLLLVMRLVTREGNPLKGGFCFVLPSLLFALPNLIRSWIVTGWPFFPFFVPFFELREGFNWDLERARLYLGWLGQFGTPLGQGTFWHSLLAPILVFIQGRFNEPEFYEGMIGPVFLLLPLVLVRTKKPLVIQVSIIFSVLFLFSWALTTKQIRFLFPVLPVLCFLLVYGLSRSKVPLIHGLVMVAVFVGMALGAHEIWKKDPIPFWFGIESRKEYLSRQLPVFRIYQDANQILSSKDKLLLVNMKNYGYYIDCLWRSDFVFERFRLDRLLRDNPSLTKLEEFFERDGITYVAVDEEFIRSKEWGFELEALRTFEDFLAQGAKRIIRRQNYSLYQLQ